MKLYSHFVVLVFFLSQNALALPADAGVVDLTERNSPDIHDLGARNHFDNVYEERSSDDTELFERNLSYGDIDARSLESRAKTRPKPPAKTTKASVLGPQSKPTFKPASKSKSAKSPTKTPGDYNISCSKYPNVCQNWCYYAYCKKKSSDPWTVTVDRKANLRSQSECKTPNRCSATDAGSWPKNPKTDWSCDEQPKNTNREGGADAATRCMPKGENSGEGSKWSAFINKKNAYVPDGSKVKVKLGFTGAAESGYCKKQCTPPVQAKGADKDDARQR